MIKLERGERPSELTDELAEELKKQYQEDKTKAVWNLPVIKPGLKKALMEMSLEKCSYCECKLGIESKDVTIDHFIAKTINSELVITWENLFPACLRCNRNKNDKTDRIVNPCGENPKEFLSLRKHNPYRLKGIDKQHIGENTINVLDLNDLERVMKPRMVECEKNYDDMEDILISLHSFSEGNITKRHLRKLERLMKRCMKDNPYSATTSANLLRDLNYQEAKKILTNRGLWSNVFITLEKQLKEIAFTFV